MPRHTDISIYPGLPFSLTTTTHGLLIVNDGLGNNLFTYCPHFGVMRGIGDFDDHPAFYEPELQQLFAAPIDDLRRMLIEWDRAERKNVRWGLKSCSRDSLPNNAPLPFIAQLETGVLAKTSHRPLRATICMLHGN